MDTKELPDPELLRKLLRYEPETGKLFWRERAREMFKTARDQKIWNTRFAEKPALSTVHINGYRHGSLSGRNYLAHRIILAMINGKWPTQVDHINGDKSDNRLLNIRAVSPSENNKNRPLQANNMSGVQGVMWNKKTRKWRAEIKVEGKVTTLGSFKDFEDAVDVRVQAEKMMGFHPNHGRNQS